MCRKLITVNDQAQRVALSAPGRRDGAVGSACPGGRLLGRGGPCAGWI